MASACAPTAAAAPPAAPAGLFRSLGRNVVALGFVSFFTDVASDIAAPILPIYLAGALHAPPVLIGLADAVPEFVASLLKPCSGWLADRTGRRKALAVAGYALSAVTKPLFAVALSGWHALLIRSVDRVGKGLRIAPRDALIADSCAPEIRGWAFGFNRAMDHMGGAVGPLIGLALLSLLGTDDLRPLFLFTAVPGLLTLLVLLVFVRDVRPAAAPASVAATPAEPPAPARAALRALTLAPFDRRFKGLLAVLFLFALGNSTDFFLLLRAHECGVSTHGIFLLWSAFHVAKSLAAGLLGRLSDRVGRVPLILAGWGVYAVAYLGFAVADSTAAVWALFPLYALYYGFTEGNEKALVADLVPPPLRATAYGLYSFTLGVAALPANLLFGGLWQLAGPPVAFGCGAALAGAAALALASIRWKGR